MQLMCELPSTRYHPDARPFTEVCYDVTIPVTTILSTFSYTAMVHHSLDKAFQIL